MGPENWFERQIREIENDPNEQAIKKMFSEMRTVNNPNKILPINSIPEFRKDTDDTGVIMVPQGLMGSTDTLPIRTDNASTCSIFLIKTPTEHLSIQYNLVHVLAGNLKLNQPGAKIEDIATSANHHSRAIGITRATDARSIIPTVRELQYQGVITVKQINVPVGNRYISTVYRPQTNEILVRVGSDVDATEVWVYDGF